MTRIAAASWWKVSTHFKHTRQMESFPQIGVKIKTYVKPP